MTSAETCDGNSKLKTQNSSLNIAEGLELALLKALLAPAELALAPLANQDRPLAGVGPGVGQKDRGVKRFSGFAGLDCDA